MPAEYHTGTVNTSYITVGTNECQLNTTQGQITQDMYITVRQTCVGSIRHGTTKTRQVTDVTYECLLNNTVLV